MTLANALNARYAGNYTQLFTPGNYLEQKGGEWVISRLKPREYDYKKLAEAIAKTDVQEIQQPEEFAIRFNQEWCPQVFKERKISLKKSLELPEKGVIKFSSKTPKFSFLSNFFPTFILCNSPQGPLKGYLSSEEAYTDWKTAQAGMTPAGEGEAREFDAQKIKKKVKRQEVRLGLREKIGEEEYDRQRLEVMQRILRAKFNQNPILKEKLLETQDFKLIEDLQDPFWGRGSSEKPGKNHLGQILESIRAEFLAA